MTWALALLAASFWLLLHPYQGLNGAAALNALTVLAGSTEPALAGDVYLLAGGHPAWGSIGPAFGSAIFGLDLESSARLLSLGGSLSWLLAFYLLARQCLPSHRAMLALGLAVTLGAIVAPYVLSAYLDNWLTARLPAGAMVLLGLALQLGNRRGLAALAMLLATGLHPLVGASGWLVWLSTWLPLRAVMAGAVAVIGGLKILTLLQPDGVSVSALVTSEQWLQWARAREPLLFPGEWSDTTWWSVTAALIPTWVLASGFSAEPTTRLLRSAVWCGLLGVAAAGLATGIVPGSPLSLAETSVWLWLPQALLGIAAAGGLVPLIRRGPATGNPVWLVLAGWLVPGWPGLVLLCTALLLWWLRDVVPERILKMLRLPSMAVFGLCGLLWGYDVLGYPAWNDRLANGVTGTLVVALAYWAGRHAAVEAICLAVGACLMFAALSAQGRRNLEPQFAVTDAATLTRWRKSIPAEAEILWPERPQASWFILGRKSYLSKLQSAAVSQSPQAAAELHERSLQLVGILPPAILFSNSRIMTLFRMSQVNLEMACSQSDADFVVSETPLDSKPVAGPLEIDWDHSRQRSTAYLYECREVRNSSSRAPAAR